MTGHLFFALGFAFLLTHELDAVRAREWKMFPGLSRLGERAGYVAFTALHVPIYALLLLGLVGGSPALIVALDVFFVVHLLLHLVLRDHPENRFGSGFSYGLIFGAGAAGALDLLLKL